MSTQQILVVGQLVKRKGIDLVLRAVAEVIKVRPNIRVTVIGSGPQRRSLERLAGELQVNSVVTFIGAVPNSEIHHHYRKSEILVSMSKSESFGVVCLEAMASGLAIVASRVGAFEEALRDGQNGYLVNTGDHQSLSSRLIELLDNPS